MNGIFLCGLCLHLEHPWGKKMKAYAKAECFECDPIGGSWLCTLHTNRCASRAAVFPSFFGQSERSLCVIYSINFNKQFDPFSKAFHKWRYNKKVALYIGLLCHSKFTHRQPRYGYKKQNVFIRSSPDGKDGAIVTTTMPMQRLWVHMCSDNPAFYI